MNELVDRLIKVGSVSALAAQVGEDAAAQAMHDLVEASPLEIKQSWPLVISWARFQAAYDAAAELGDSAGMIRAAEAQSKMLTGLY